MKSDVISLYEKFNVDVENLIGVELAPFENRKTAFLCKVVKYEISTSFRHRRTGKGQIPYRKIRALYELLAFGT